jgi:hypothetical protein
VHRRNTCRGVPFASCHQNREYYPKGGKVQKMAVSSAHVRAREGTAG